MPFDFAFLVNRCRFFSHKICLARTCGKREGNSTQRRKEAKARRKILKEYCLSARCGRDEGTASWTRFTSPCDAEGVEIIETMVSICSAVWFYAVAIFFHTAIGAMVAELAKMPVSDNL